MKNSVSLENVEGHEDGIDQSVDKINNYHKLRNLSYGVFLFYFLANMAKLEWPSIALREKSGGHNN